MHSSSLWLYTVDAAKDVRDAESMIMIVPPIVPVLARSDS